MKHFAIILVALTMLFYHRDADAQTNITTLRPTESVAYTPVKSGQKQIMMGGLAVTTGFSLGQSTQYLITPEKVGKVTFPLNGKYSKLTFMMGPMANSQHISDSPTIVTVRGDGRKLLDEKFQDWDISRPYEIDVTGVKELTFDILAGDGYIGVGKPQLWTAGQKVVKPDYDRTPAKTKMVLLKTRAPYYYDKNNVVLVSPNEKIKSFKINGKEYDNGLVLNMRMQILGGDYGCAMYNLKGQYDKLSFILGALDNTVNAEQGQGYLTVQADGRTIYQKDLAQLNMAEQVVLDVSGVDRLSFHSSQNKWNLSAGFADITAWPKGEGPSLGVTSVAAPSNLKSLPDVVPLLSTIEPFNVLGGQSRENMLYTGESQYLGFGMGGEKYSEGMIFTSGANFLHDHIFTSASFDLGNQFDYMTFVTGFMDGP
ncbi:MAG: NPCBM/NEW2 domain-containing protein, partial [Muribaculaceae bacterium]|nr:NPCBM/NEW2 domain-containing protein [Muribaculaceae bacterium]